MTGKASLAGTRLWTWLRRRPVRALVRIGLVTGSAASVAIGIEALARARLDADGLDAPTRFFARPVVLRVGADADRARVADHLRRLGYREVRRNPGIGEFVLGSRRWVIGRRAFRHFDQLDAGGVASVDLDYGDRVASLRDERGTSLPYVVLEPELIGRVYGDTREDRVPVRLSDIPAPLIDAVLAIEDRRFYAHRGIDVRRIAGALVADIRTRRLTQGASTLTQQLAKNLFLSARRSPIRKLREITMALVLERRHTKAEILEAYLNQVYLGQDGALALHGVGRAAQFYFGKDISQVDTAESALLAGMIRGPSLYSPYRHPDNALARRNLVLAVMGASAVLSADVASRLAVRPLRLRTRVESARGGRYFVDHVRDWIAAEYGRDTLGTGLAVFTTLDMERQRVAEAVVTRELARLERQYPRLARQDTPLQAALVAIDPRTGEVLAMVGGRDYGQSQFNRALFARRQPGSSFKPIVAMTALQADAGFTLASELEDEPLSLPTPAGPWRPANYDGRFRGTITLREALERSLNVPFARLGLAVGPERIVETARRLGIEGPLTAVPSIALGSSDVTPFEMARAYGVFAARGFRATSHVTLGIVDRAGVTVGQARLDGERPFSEAESYLVTSALRGAVERGTGQALRAAGFLGPVAAKSGTTNDFRDAWFIGYTPAIAVAVWVGFDDGRSIGLSGSRAALPIFARFLEGALGSFGDDDFVRPPGIEVADVDCRGEIEIFLAGTAPRWSCSPFRSARSSWASRAYTRVQPLLETLRRRGRNSHN
ncbi:MAG TPA: PBP1A family penicillin-binding protein [Gemmatimonadales bacterium]